MESFVTQGDVVLRLDPGDEVVASIERFLAESDLETASVTGIGAVSEATLGRYILSERRYEAHELSGEYEIVALLGNVALKDGRPHAHLHMALSDEHGHMHGGHLTHAVVSVTCELVFHRLDVRLTRVPDPRTGLMRLAGA